MGGSRIYELCENGKSRIAFLQNKRTENDKKDLEKAVFTEIKYKGHL